MIIQQCQTSHGLLNSSQNKIQPSWCCAVLSNPNLSILRNIQWYIWCRPVKIHRIATITSREGKGENWKLRDNKKKIPTKLKYCLTKTFSRQFLFPITVWTQAMPGSEWPGPRPVTRRHCWPGSSLLRSVVAWLSQGSHLPDSHKAHISSHRAQLRENSGEKDSHACQGHIKSSI